MKSFSVSFEVQPGYFEAKESEAQTFENLNPGKRWQDYINFDDMVIIWSEPVYEGGERP